MHHHLDGAQRSSGEGGDLLVRQAVDIAQDGGRPIVVRQLTQRADQGGAVQPLGGLSPDLVDELVQGGRLGAAPLAAPQIEGGGDRPPGRTRW